MVHVFVDQRGVFGLSVRWELDYSWCMSEGGGGVGAAVTRLGLGRPMVNLVPVVNRTNPLQYLDTAP